MIDYTKYFDRPWVAGRYDCWSFIREVYRLELKIELPFICVDASNLFSVINEFRNSEIYSMFEKVEQPIDFDVTLIGRKDSSHAGLYFSPENIFHNDRKSGVLLQKIPEIEKLDFIKGYYRCKLR